MSRVVMTALSVGLLMLTGIAGCAGVSSTADRADTTVTALPTVVIAQGVAPATLSDSGATATLILSPSTDVMSTMQVGDRVELQTVDTEALAPGTSFSLGVDSLEALSALSALADDAGMLHFEVQYDFGALPYAFSLRLPNFAAAGPSSGVVDPTITPFQLPPPGELPPVVGIPTS